MTKAKSLSKSLEEIQKAYWRPFLEKDYDNLARGIELLEAIENCLDTELRPSIKVCVIESFLKDYKNE